MTRSRVGVALGAVLVGLALWWLLARPAARPIAPIAPDETLLFSFEAGSMSGAGVLVLGPGGSRIEHEDRSGIEALSMRVHGAAPPGAGHVYVRNQVGRATVDVVQQPNAENGFETRVLVDASAGRAPKPVRFELVAAPPQPLARPFNVLVVTLDSLRPDRLGSYGYPRARTPNLDAFARESVRFQNAFSTSSFTPPSHASLFTSRYVGDHGLLTWNELPPEALTLAEILARHGFRTGASVNLDLLSGQALGQGMQWVRESVRDGSVIVGDALSFLDEPDPRPWFLWLHLYDVHRPYKRVPGAGGAVPETGDVNEHYNLKPKDVTERGLDPNALQHIDERYDAGVTYTDALLAPLLARLDTPAERANTLVVITADHGENLLERPDRLFSHDPFLYSVVTRVPLLIRFPGGVHAGEVSDELVSLIDVAPTVLDVVGLGAPPGFQGLSLAGVGAAGRLARDAIFHESWGWEEQKAIRTRDWLVLRDVKEGETRSYALAADPGEVHPIPGVPEAAADVGARLEAFVTRVPGKGAPPLGPEMIERLRALGYVDE